MQLRGQQLGAELTQFLLEERSRRSFGVTGYLLSGGGAGAVTCWFQIGSLYAYRAPQLVLHLLLVASGIFLLAVVVGFAAALAGYKAFEAALLVPDEAFSRPSNSAERWAATAEAARVLAAALIALGGLTTFAAYAVLAWP